MLLQGLATYCNKDSIFPQSWLQVREILFLFVLDGLHIVCMSAFVCVCECVCKIVQASMYVRVC